MPKEKEVEVQQEELAYQMWMPRNFDVDFSDFLLWCTVVMVFIDPFFRFLVGILESQHQMLCHSVGRSLAFFFCSMVSYAYSFFVFIMFHKTIGIQPRLRDLQRNEVLIIGYSFVLTGLIVKAYIYISKPIATILGGHYFKLESLPRKVGPDKDDPYYHPLGTSSVICYFGYSIVRASAAGMFVTISLAIGYCIASQAERLFLSRKLEQYIFIPISSSAKIRKGEKSLSK